MNSGNNIEKIIKINKNESGAAKILYGTVLGRCILKILINPIISKIVGAYMNTKASTIHIKRFIINNNIEMADYKDVKYKSFNDFFTRKVKEGKRIVDMNPKHLITPCDSRVISYTIGDKTTFTIKGTNYSIKDLLKNEELAEKYKGGTLYIFRLCVDDYHRYCYIDSGRKQRNIYIKGKLHTVRPIALERYNIYKENSREYTILHTDNFGDVCQVEVGAMLVGKIKNNHEEYSFTKGEEKGMFEFGGSTIALILEKDKVKVDQNILKNSRKELETKVKLGSKVGEKI